MVGFGVAAETVRAAVALDRDEVSTAPSLALQLHQLGSVIGQHEAVLLGQLAWTVLPPERPACGGVAAGVPGAPVGAEAPVSQRVVEISFDIALPEDLREKARAQTITSISTMLAQLDGASVIRDPAKGLDKAALSGGGTRAGTDKALSWCLTLPGASKLQGPT